MKLVPQKLVIHEIKYEASYYKIGYLQSRQAVESDVRMRNLNNEGTYMQIRKNDCEKLWT